MRKADAAPKKRVTAAKKGAKPSTDQIKKKEKEEKARQDEENKANKRREEYERGEISKEVAEFN